MKKETDNLERERASLLGSSNLASKKNSGWGKKIIFLILFVLIGNGIGKFIGLSELGNSTEEYEEVVEEEAEG